jgi:hypothetical protein
VLSQQQATPLPHLRPKARTGSHHAHMHVISAAVQGDDVGRQPVAIAAMVATHPAAPASGDAPQPIPLGRWDIEDYPDKASSRQQSRFGSFVDRAEYFDAAAFNISRCLKTTNTYCKLLHCIRPP